MFPSKTKRRTSSSLRITLGRANGYNGVPTKKSIGYNGTRGTMRTVTMAAVTILIDKRPDRLYRNPQLINGPRKILHCAR